MKTSLFRSRACDSSSEKDWTCDNVKITCVGTIVGTVIATRDKFSRRTCEFSTIHDWVPKSANVSFARHKFSASVWVMPIIGIAVLKKFSTECVCLCKQIYIFCGVFLLYVRFSDRPGTKRNVRSSDHTRVHTNEFRTYFGTDGPTRIYRYPWEETATGGRRSLPLYPGRICYAPLVLLSLLYWWAYVCATSVVGADILSFADKCAS